MTISSKGRYALCVLIDLAEHGDGSYIPMKVVAQRQGLPLKYLEHILPILKQNRIVEGVPGKGGGYRLVRRPEEYTIGEILRMVEGELAMVSPTELNTDSDGRNNKHRTIPMWKNLQTIIDDYFDGITLKDLLEDASNNLSSIELSFLDAAL